MVKRHRHAPPVEYEPFETSVLLNCLLPGAVAIDIGANHGQYTPKFLKSVGPSGEVFSFEPDPTNFEILKKQTASVESTNLHLENIAVSNVSGVAYLYINTRNPGDHRLYDSHDARAKIAVPTIRLDDYFSLYTRPISLIKMDIQGFEFYAIEGMSDLLRRQEHITIASEFWPWGLLTAGSQPAAFLGNFLSMGFSLFEIKEHEGRLGVINSVDYFLSHLPASDIYYTNILAKR